MQVKMKVIIHKTSFGRMALCLMAAIMLTMSAVADTIYFSGNPGTSWNGKVVKNPDDFRFKHRASTPGYFEFIRGRDNALLGMLESNPLIDRIEINDNYGEEDRAELEALIKKMRATAPEVEITNTPGVTTKETTTVRTSEKLTVYSLNKWGFINDREIPLRLGNAIFLGNIVRTPKNSRLRLEYKKKNSILMLGMMSASSVELIDLAANDLKYYVRLSLAPGSSVWLKIGESIRTSEIVNFDINGIVFESHRLLANVAVKEDGHVFVTNYDHAELKVDNIEKVETIMLPGGHEVDMTAQEGNPIPATKDRADWDNWEIWTPEEGITYPPTVHPGLMESFDPYGDIYVARVGESAGLPNIVQVQPQGVLHIVQTWREWVELYVNNTGKPGPDVPGEAGLEAVRQEMKASGSIANTELPTRDNWGNPFVWKVLQSGNNYIYDVHSIGPNGIDEFGLGDDL
jgi:hypothetical protein